MRPIDISGAAGFGRERAFCAMATGAWLPKNLKSKMRGTDAQPSARRVGGGRACTSPPPSETNQTPQQAESCIWAGWAEQPPTGIAPPLQSGAAAWRSCRARLHLRQFPFSGAPGSCPGELLRAHPPPGKKAAAARRTQQSALWLGAPAHSRTMCPTPSDSACCSQRPELSLPRQHQPCR